MHHACMCTVFEYQYLLLQKHFLFKCLCLKGGEIETAELHLVKFVYSTRKYRLLILLQLIAGDTPGDYKDLKPNNPNIKVEDGTLTINNIQKTNEGYYLCEAVNGIGSGLSAVILISVQGTSFRMYTLNES